MPVNDGRDQNRNSREDSKKEGLEQRLIDQLQAEEIHRLVVEVDKVEENLDVELIKNQVRLPIVGPAPMN